MIRVATWTLGASPDVRAAAEVLGGLRPDLVLLGDQPAGVAAMRRLLSGTRLRVASRAGKGRSGSAVLVGEDVRVLSEASLRLEGAGTTREAAHAIVGVGGRTLSTLAFRLGADPEGRLADAREIAAFLDRIGQVDVIGGDLGEGAGGPCSEPLLHDRVDAWSVAGVGSGDTYPTPEPTARHDVVVVDAGIAMGSARVPAAPPIDTAARHRPVVVELEEQQ